MAFQYPKSVTAKYVKSKLGDRDEYKTMVTAITDYEKRLSEFDENNPGDIVSFINEIQNVMKNNFVRPRDTAVKNLEKKVKAAKDKAKAAVEKDLKTLNDLSTEMEGGHKVVINQLLTLQKESEGRVKWDDFYQKCAPESAFLTGLEKTSSKETAAIASALMQIGEALKHPETDQQAAAKKKQELKEKLDELVKTASRKYVTGGPGFASFEDAYKIIKNKFMLANLSPVEAGKREDILKRLDAAVPLAMKRRDTIQKSFDALTAVLSKQAAATASAPTAAKTA